MELEELKKSWNALDKQLQKEPVANERQIAELIKNYKASTHKSLGSLIGVQHSSIGIGIAGMACCLLAWLLLPAFGLDKQWHEKISVFLVFIALSLLAGMWWDWKTYRWIKHTRIDEMSVAEVSRRMVIFRQWVKYEVIAISVWGVLFNVFNYWMMNYHLAPAGVQALIIAIFVIADTAIVYLLYKKLIYKHLDKIKKNIEELKDICTE